jgi:cytochrome b6-f complex iron-sulfur subunit
MTELHEGRRRFLSTCLCAAAAPLIGACASLATHPVPVSGGRVRIALADHPDLARASGAIKILPDGMRDPFFVLANDDGSYTTLTTVCTHRGCEVDIQGPLLKCPCHGSTYDRDGRVLKGPAERPLARLATTMSAGVIEIDLGRPG